MQGLQLMSWRLHQCLHVYSTWLSWLESPGACPPCASSSRTCQSGVSSPLDTFKILIVSYALTNCQVQHYTDSADVCNWHIPGSLLISSLWEWSLLLMHMLYKQFLTIPHITIKRPTSFFFLLCSGKWCMCPATNFLTNSQASIVLSNRAESAYSPCFYLSHDRSLFKRFCSSSRIHM